MVRVTLKPRANYAREIILLMVASSVVTVLTLGDSGVMFLYMRERFGWTLTKFTLYNSAMSVLSILGNIIGTFLLHKYLSVTESVLIMMGLLSAIDGHLLQGLATKDWHIYVGKYVCFCLL